jgi:hypothetical protein
VNTLTIDMCVNALNWAALSRKSIFQVELAVGLAIFVMGGGVDRSTKKQLCDIYQSAGYECVEYGSIDYKTINRRINATAELYQKLGVGTLKKWIRGQQHEKILDAIVDGLRDYKFMNAADVVAKGAKHLETEHLAIAVPNETPRDELIEMAMWLLAMAEEMKKEAEATVTA